MDHDLRVVVDRPRDRGWLICLPAGSINSQAVKAADMVGKPQVADTMAARS